MGTKKEKTLSTLNVLQCNFEIDDEILRYNVTVFGVYSFNIYKLVEFLVAYQLHGI